MNDGKIEVFNAEKESTVREQRLRDHQQLRGTIEIPNVTSFYRHPMSVE